jgi:hypothetical protein
MADAIRLQAEFTDDLGNDWQVNIHDSDYFGSIVPFKLGADGFVLRYSGNNEDRYQPVIGSEVTFTLTEENSDHTTFMDLLATNVEVRFSVSVRKDPDGTDDFWWGGILLPEQVVRPFDYYPIQNTLTASDDLGNLQSVKYNNDGAAYTGEASVVEHLLNCLNKTRATHLWGTDDFLYYVNDFDSSDYTGSDQLDDTRISHYGLYNPDENGVNQYYSALEVLESLARVFNARIFQAQGKWWFLPVGAQKYSTTLTVEGTQKDGTAITQQSIAAAKAFDSTFERLRGYEYSYLAPLKTVTRTRRFNGNWPVILDNLYTEAQFGTTLSDTDIDYVSGTVLAVSGTFNYTYDGDGTSTGNDRVSRVELEFTIKIGTKYLQRNVTYTGSQLVFNGFGDPDEFPYEYTTHVYGNTSLSSSASTYTIVSPIFDKQDGESLTIPFYIELPALASDESGLDITVDINGIDDTGAADTDLTNTTDADYEIVVLRADVIGDEALGDTVSFTATNSDTARADLDQGEVLFGDYQTVNADGTISFIEGFLQTFSTSWQSLNYTGTGLSINKLAVQEILGGQVKPTRIQRGEVYGLPIYMWQVIDDTDGDYALFEMTYTARSLTNEVEAFLISRDISGVTADQDDVKNTTTPITEADIVKSATAFQASNKMLGDGYEGYGSRDQRANREIGHNPSDRTTVGDTDLHIFNTWKGSNGAATIALPPIAESHGRIIQFHSDSTISANTYVRLEPATGDTGVTIDGNAYYDFNRAYDGITILGHTDGNWYIIQKKEK